MSESVKESKQSKLFIRSACFLLLIIFGHYLVTVILPESKRLPERGPIAAAQKFILQDSTSKRVVVGSSFADRLDPFNSDPATTMITINGGSAFDGLALIKERAATKNLLDVIAIEVNRLIVFDEKEWVEQLLKSPNKKIWKSAAILRDHNRPFSVIGWPIHTVLNKVYLTLSTPPSKKESIANVDEEIESEIQERLDRNIAEQKKYLETGIEDEKLLKILEKLENYVKEFQSQGTKVVFFNMPIHPELEVLETPSKLLAGVREKFPESEYLWLEDVDASQYNYTDGIHLDPESAQRYHGILTRKFEELAKD